MFAFDRRCIHSNQRSKKERQRKRNWCETRQMLKLIIVIIISSMKIREVECNLHDCRTYTYPRWICNCFCSHDFAIRRDSIQSRGGIRRLPVNEYVIALGSISMCFHRIYLFTSSVKCLQHLNVPVCVCVWHIILPYAHVSFFNVLSSCTACTCMYTSNKVNLSVTSANAKK